MQQKGEDFSWHSAMKEWVNQAKLDLSDDGEQHLEV